MFHDFYDVGGTVSMTAHLFHGLGLADKKLVWIKGKKCSDVKDYSYGLKKQSVPFEILNHCKDIFIMHLDLDSFESVKQSGSLNRSDITYILHDVGLRKANSAIEFIKDMQLKGNEKWKLIVIRKTMEEYFKKINIKTEFIHHPWYDFPIKHSTDLNQKKGAIAVTRLSYNKHIEIMFDANDMLPENHQNIIDVHGMKNSPIYNYHVLKLDRMAKYWKGRFEASFEKVSELLSPKKFVISLSKLPHDGGGTEYSTMEAIYHDCAVVLHRDWIRACEQSGIKSDFEEGYNCFAIESAQELKDLMIKDPDTDDIVKNARSILDEPRKSFKNWSKYLKV